MSEEQWGEYFDRLEGPEGCDFREKEPGNPDSVTFLCKGGMDKTFSEKILSAMGIPDDRRFGVLRYVENLGGHCDCEVLFNAAERVYEDLGVEPNPYALTPEQIAELVAREEAKEAQEK